MNEIQQKLLNSKEATLIDVREPYEFEESHAFGAENIPLGELSRHLNRLEAAPKPILLYCKSGIRSGTAEIMLRQFGIEDAHNIGGVAAVIAAQQLS